MSIKVTTLVTNAQRVRFALAAEVPATRARLREAVQQTTEAVALRARTNVPVSGSDSRKAKGRPGPGELRDSIRTAYSTDGLRGYVMAGFGKLPRRSRAKKPPKMGPMRLASFQRQQRRLALKAQREIAVYAMVIEYGSPGRGIAASRYINRAKDAEQQPHLTRVRRALAQAAQSTGLGGGTVAA